MTSYLTSIDTMLLSILYRFQVIRLQNFQGLTLTFDLRRSSGVEKIILFESSYMTSYLTSIDTMHLSILYRFRVIRLQNFQDLTLTFDLRRSSGVEKIILFESSYMTSYLTSIDTTELSTGRMDPRVGSGHDFAGFWRVGSGQHFGIFSFY